MQGMGFIVIYIVFFAALIYFTSIRPQKKERQKQQEMLSSVAVGDTILTTSGFYGVIIDMTDDTVIVEFGSNKNCRIPMQKGCDRSGREARDKIRLVFYKENEH